MDFISVKALSEELGITKPTLFSRIDKLNLRSELQKQGRALMIPAETTDKLRASFKSAQKEELKSKNEIINRLQNQIENLQEDNRRYIYQNTQLLLSSGSGAEAEPVEAEFTEAEAERTENEPREEPKKSFFRRLFGM